MNKEDLIKELSSYSQEEKDSLMDVIEGIYLVDPREFTEIDYYDENSMYREEAECFGLKNFTLIFTLIRSKYVLDDYRTIDTLIDMYKSGADIDLDLISLILQIGEEFCIGAYMEKVEELNSFKDEIKKEFLNSGNIDLDQIDY